MNRRARLELVHSAAASSEEAAAVVAAIEQFLRDTTPPLAPREPEPDRWLQAALREGVERAPGPGLW